MVIKYKASNLIEDFNLNAKTTLTELTELFGTEITPVHATIDGYGLEFPYDAKTEMYTVPLTGITPIYTPDVINKTTLPNSIVLTVACLAGDGWEQGENGEMKAPVPDKYLKITLREKDGAYYISAIQNTSTPEIATTEEKIETTLRLAEIVSSAIPAKFRRNGHPARKTFQAIRIEVNGELEHLKAALDSVFDSLNSGSRLAIITFHSLEDRIVKQTFADLASGCTCPKEFPVCVCGKTPRGELPFKFRTASDEELERNPRSRSATLRAIEKLHD